MAGYHLVWDGVHDQPLPIDAYGPLIWVVNVLNSGAYDAIDPGQFCKEILTK